MGRRGSATGAAGPTPPIHALGLLEPQSRRYLDVISEQLGTQISAAVAAGHMSRQAADALNTSVATIITDLRASGTLPAGVPSVLTSLFNPSTSKFLSEADRYDPAQLASTLPKGFPVLVSCSDADVQVSCGDVDHLVSGLRLAKADVDFVTLRGADHVLKEDSSRTGGSFRSPLPFSSQLQERQRSFVTGSLG